MIGAGLGLALAVLAQTPTLSPRDTQLYVGFPPDLHAATGEQLVRSALYGQLDFERRFGRRASLAWSSDTRSAPPQLGLLLFESGLQLVADTPGADSTRFPVVSRLSTQLHERADAVILTEMLAALDTSPYPRAAFAGAWRFDSLAGALGPLRDSAFAHLAAGLDTRGSGVPVVVFNPAPWVRSAAVAVPLDPALRLVGRGTGELRAVDAARRGTAAVRDRDSLRFAAREVPPVGLKVFWIRAGRSAAGGEDPTARAGVTAAPLLARSVPARPGLAGSSWSFVSIDPATVRLTALKRAEQTGAKVLRLADQSGEATTATVTFGPRVARVRVATLLEDPLRTLPLSPDGRSVTLTLRPWDIVTLLVEDAR